MRPPRKSRTTPATTAGSRTPQSTWGRIMRAVSARGARGADDHVDLISERPDHVVHPEVAPLQCERRLEARDRFPSPALPGADLLDLGLQGFRDPAKCQVARDLVALAGLLDLLPLE